MLKEINPHATLITFLTICGFVFFSDVVFAKSHFWRPQTTRVRKEQHRSILDRTAMLQQMASAVANFSKFSREKYGSFGPSIYKRLQKIHPDFVQLMIDPGLVMRIDIFERLAKKGEFAHLSPWEARRKFEERLGYVELYRVVGFNNATLKVTEKFGLESTYLRKMRRLKNDHATAAPIALGIQLPKGTFANYISEGRLGGQKHLDLFTSVTSYPEVGTVAAGYADFQTQFFLFTLKVPRLSIVHQDNKNGPFRNPWQTHGPKTKVVPYTAYNLDDNEKHFSRNRFLESFIFLKIFPSEIKAVKKLSDEDMWGEQPPYLPVDKKLIIRKPSNNSLLF